MRVGKEMSLSWARTWSSMMTLWGLRATVSDLKEPLQDSKLVRTRSTYQTTQMVPMTRTDDGIDLSLDDENQDPCSTTFRPGERSWKREEFDQCWGSLSVLRSPYTTASYVSCIVSRFAAQQGWESWPQSWMNTSINSDNRCSSWAVWGTIFAH